MAYESIVPIRKAIERADGEWRFVPTQKGKAEYRFTGSLSDALVEALAYSRELSPETPDGIGLVIMQRGPWAYLRATNWQKAYYKEGNIVTPSVQDEVKYAVLVHDRSDVNHPGVGGPLGNILVEAVAHAGAHQTGVLIRSGRLGDEIIYGYIRVPKTSPLYSKQPTKRESYR
jgi:hypothetical protein